MAGPMLIFWGCVLGYIKYAESRTSYYLQNSINEIMHNNNNILWSRVNFQLTT